MAAVDEIAVKLGIKTGDFKAALADAGVTLKKFKKDAEGDDKNSLSKQFDRAKNGIEKFRQVLAGAGVVALIKQINDAANKFAEEYVGAYDDAVAATLRLKNEQADFGSVIQKITGRIGVELVGAMDKFGTAVGAMIYGTDAASDALNKLEAENRKAFDDAKLKKFREEQEKLAKVVRDNALQSASDNQKINILAGEYVKILQEQARLNKDSVEWVRKTAEAEQKRGELQRQEAETRKKENDERLKAADQERESAEALAQARALDAKEEEELFVLQRKNAASLTAAEKERKDVLEQQKVIKIKQVEIDELMKKKLSEGLTPEEAKRLDTLISQRNTLQEQLENKTQQTKKIVEEQLPAEKLITSEMEEQVRQAKMATEEAARELQIQKSRQTTVRNVGSEQNLSDVQLDQLILNLNKQISAIKATSGPPIMGYTPPEQLMLQQNLQGAIKERDLRRQFQQTASFFGNEKTERMYAPNDFARLSQLFNPDQQKKDSTNLAVLASGMQSMFPDKFNGALR